MTTTSDSLKSPNRSPLITWLAGLAVVGVVALVVVFAGGGSSDEAEGSPINDFVFTNEDGSSGTLADFQGEPLVVNFFASWCAPCRAELPDFEAVHVASTGDVQFIGVNHDFDETSWRSFVEETELTYPTVFQPEQEIWTELELLGTPATIFITPEGEVVHTFTGVLNQEALKDLIVEHLAVEI
ncbi:MAG: TlpA family protein disulfide reductase [Actinomycetia bacterium]|nr:TlpA family protein disulfide reductase [Actinomycetes bacterium]MCP5035386.1 TlpA family protein disulfide reductase [Actinomycetes bacterium]